MISAFFFLQFTSLRNGLKQRLLRLKKPKYLFGAIFGAAYFYLFFFRHVIHGSPASSRAMASSMPSFEPMLEPLGASLLVIVVAVAWIFPSARAALQFTETEVAFLFPAPVTRRSLIHFKLLKSQLGILFSALFFGLLSNRITWLGGGAVMHSLGWWVILSTINLHLLGASFARERLLQRGITARLRLLIGLLFVVIAGAGFWVWIKASLPPIPSNLATWKEVQPYVLSVLGTTPVTVLLFLPMLVLKPFFAADTVAFLLAIGPALLVMAAHYWWVMRSEISFEDASIKQASQLAEKTAALKAGDWQKATNAPQKPRKPAFNLRAHGPVVVAFLWKNLTAMGGFYRLRTWWIAAGAIVAFHLWAAAVQLDKVYYTIIAIVPLVLGGWFLVVAPMIMRRDLRLLITHFDLLKSYPLRGWQVVSGSLLSPIVLIAATEWLLLLLGAPCIGFAHKAPHLAAGVLGVGTLGIAVVLPPLVGLMLSIPFAATLFFPAWSDSSASVVGAGGGIEVMGQRLIFFFGYILVMIVTLIPAALCASVAAIIVNWMLGPLSAVIATTLVASVVISAEFATVVWWLGEKFERFDLSQEMPR